MEVFLCNGCVDESLAGFAAAVVGVCEGVSPCHSAGNCFYTCMILGFGSAHTKGSYKGSQRESAAPLLPASLFARGCACDPGPPSSPPGTPISGHELFWLDQFKPLLPHAQPWFWCLAAEMHFLKPAGLASSGCVSRKTHSSDTACSTPDLFGKSSCFSPTTLFPAYL